MRDQHLLDQFSQDGFLIVRSLLSGEEAKNHCQRRTTLRTSGTYELDHKGVDTDEEDPEEAT